MMANGIDCCIDNGIELVASGQVDATTVTGKRLMVLSVSAGNGHVRAADAIVAHARADYPSLTVRHHDVLKLV
ncbi:MAG: hypothetical protein ACKO65_05750, partial [Betaproteobacteria bacterium]